MYKLICIQLLCNFYKTLNWIKQILIKMIFIAQPLCDVNSTIRNLCPAVAAGHIVWGTKDLLLEKRIKCFLNPSGNVQALLYGGQNIFLMSPGRYWNVWIFNGRMRRVTITWLNKRWITQLGVKLLQWSCHWLFHLYYAISFVYSFVYSFRVFMCPVVTSANDWILVSPFICVPSQVYRNHFLHSFVAFVSVNMWFRR